MPPKHGNMTIGKPKNTKATLKRIFSYMYGFKVHLIVIVLAIIFSSGAGVAGNYLLSPIIDNYITPYIGHKNPKLSGFISLLCVMAGIYLLGAVCTFLYQRLMLKVSTTTLYRIRTDLFNKMESLPIRYFDKHTHGDLMSLYTNDTDALREMLSTSVVQFINSAITVTGVFTAMLIYSWRLTIIVVVMLALMIFVVGFIGQKSGKGFKEQQQALGSVNGYIEEMIEGQKVIKVFCHEDEACSDFNALNEKLCIASTKANTFANILMPIMNNLSYLHYAATAIAGGIMAVKGTGGMTIGKVVSYLQFTRSFSQPITQISQQLNAVLAALAGAERIFDVMKRPSEVDDGYVELVNITKNDKGTIQEVQERTGMWAWKHPHKNGKVTYSELKGDVVFENVTFGYEPNKIVLKNISLYARPGQKIALVGSTGAGKTTITNLINRFYEIQSGKIRYDGINIQKIKKDDLRHSLAMVLQDTHLFTGTVMENIRYGKLDATDEECIEAARLAGADDFINKMAEGYNTYLTNNGTNLSQGQRQLIAIARAAVADPPVMILDEATSSIDTRTELKIQDAFNTLMKDKTSFIVAHRLSTIKEADLILVMNNGNIIEQGNHQELLAKNGFYAKLYNSQFEE